jgi:hypothetical protein
VSPRRRRACSGWQWIRSRSADSLYSGYRPLLRSVRKRTDRIETAYGLFALVALGGLPGLALQIVRYPQLSGLEIKASYLLFTAPCWAVFSVAAWIALKRRTRKAGPVLVTVAALYLISYGASIANAFNHTYDGQSNPVEVMTYVDLETSIENDTPSRPTVQGSEADFAVWVNNSGTGSAGDVILEIKLDPALRLLGPPSFERGPGCVGTTDITCPLTYLPPGVSTPIRFGVELSGQGPKPITASASTGERDANYADNHASYILNVVPPGR